MNPAFAHLIPADIAAMATRNIAAIYPNEETVMHPSFEIWTRSNAPLMTFDREDRAREEFARRRIPKAKLMKVTRVVEELA